MQPGVACAILEALPFIDELLALDFAHSGPELGERTQANLLISVVEVFPE